MSSIDDQQKSEKHKHDENMNIREQTLTSYTLTSYTPYICSGILGYLSHNVLKPYLHVGSSAVYYYAEAHTNKWNAIIHTLGMPFTVFGVLQWIPAFLGLDSGQSKILAYMLYTLYAGHYVRMDKRICLLYLILYYLPVKYAVRVYNTYDPTTQRLWLFQKGVITMLLALTFQESIGHYVGGDIPSRPEGVLNAIIYAMYFSVSHWV